MMIEINGMAHVVLTVSRFEVAREFYRKLLPEFGMKVVHDGDKLFYCVGARTAIGIEPCDPALAGERFAQQRVGLHHLCLRARSREDVDRCGALLKEMKATIVRGPMEGTWAPGYYYVLFEDPDGIRLEVKGPRTCDMTGDSATAEMGGGSRRQSGSRSMSRTNRPLSPAGVCFKPGSLGAFDEGDLSLAAVGQPLVFQAQGA
jgi:catechol 2,3-dioxygenase-like lactoylglutathione lyase family enzyme